MRKRIGSVSGVRSCRNGQSKRRRRARQWYRACCDCMCVLLLCCVLRGEMFVEVSQRERREKRSQQPARGDASAVALGLGDWKTGGGGRSVSPQPEPKQAQSSHTLSLRHSMHRPSFSLRLCLPSPPLLSLVHAREVCSGWSIASHSAMSRTRRRHLR